MYFVKPSRTLDGGFMVGYDRNGEIWRQCDNCNVVLPPSALSGYHIKKCVGRSQAVCDVCEKSESVFWMDKVTPFTEEPFYANICHTCSRSIERGPQRYAPPLSYYLMKYPRVWHILLILLGVGVDTFIHASGLV